MKLIHRVGFAVLVCCAVVAWWISMGGKELHSPSIIFTTPVSSVTNLTTSSMPRFTPPTANTDRPPEPIKIVLSVVVCGDRVNETFVMIKSALALTKSFLHFIIIAEERLHISLENKLKSLPTKILQNLNYTIHPVTFPFGKKSGEEWKKLFKPCSSQRLFLPMILSDVDALLYVDTDVLFLRPPECVWSHFSRMNSSQMAAMTPEHEDHATGWYNRFARHPYYPPLGVNSGVMLMNLTRMRIFQWNRRIIPIYKDYKYKITWGDQDILNIVFHFHPDKLYVYPCEWNYRSDHCMYTSVCKSADEHGVSVLHGSRSVFHNGKQEAFRAIYSSFQEYNLGGDVKMDLLAPLKRNLQKTTHTNCGKIYRIFLKSISDHERNISQCPS